MEIHFGRAVQQYGPASDLEFLVTADGAYCSSSVGGNTRKYHGLLAHGNKLRVSGVEEYVNGFRISVQRFNRALRDEGLLRLRRFSVYPPKWLYIVNDVVVQKTILLDGSLKIRYEIYGEADLSIRPLLADRPIDQVRRNPLLEYEVVPGGVRNLDLQITSAMDFQLAPETYWELFYEKEWHRGFDEVEDVHSPGVFSTHITNDTAEIDFALDGVSLNSHCRQVPHSELDWLERASNSFFTGGTIVAGYHWFFESWGRDAFICIPGFFIDRDRKEDAEQVFRYFTQRMKGGVIPNRLPDSYFSSDASLWFLYALEKYDEKWHDEAFLREMRPYIEEIMVSYPKSNVARLDGALISVSPATTWMDTLYSPRDGKPIEINALWAQALGFAERLGIQTPVASTDALSALDRFWNADRHCFYDRIDPLDPSIRPNQVIPMALGLIDQDRARQALSVVKRTLYTPYGLRTLAPGEKHYYGYYRGDVTYHNGSAWPFLMGFFVEALLRSGEDPAEVRLLLIPLFENLSEAGLGYIAECFDGDPPHTPQGCIAQAWSIAELARAYRMVYSRIRSDGTV
jgi:glycogen debranching enzyme